MKILFFTAVFFAEIICAIAQPSDYYIKVKHFQDSMNAVQSDPKTTQIIAEEFPDFKGLQFFVIDEKFKISAQLKEDATHEVFKLTYSNDPNVPVYVTYGTITFSFKNVSYTFNVYQNKEWLENPVYKNHLFLPFKDWTNGPQSYGGGRFMDLIIPASGDKITVDFNLSYNPPCAYNYYMACPLIPESNHLEAEVLAGIMTY